MITTGRLYGTTGNATFEFTNPKSVLINYDFEKKILNNLFSLYANKEDETGCVSCIGGKRIVQRILMGKPELKRKLKKS